MTVRLFWDGEEVIGTQREVIDWGPDATQDMRDNDWWRGFYEKAVLDHAAGFLTRYSLLHKGIEHELTLRLIRYACANDGSVRFRVTPPLYMDDASPYGAISFDLFGWYIDGDES